MKTLAAHGLAGGIVQDRMGGSFGAGFLSGSLGSYLSSPGNCITHSVSNNHLNKDTCKIYRNGFGNYYRYKSKGKMSIWIRRYRARQNGR
jgi:hypothetical protein